MFTNLVSILALVGQPVLLNGSTPSSLQRHGFDRPRVEVWTNYGDNPYHAGQRARVFVRADHDAFVTVFRVDTDGRVRVLFPRQPWDDGFVRGDHEFEVEGSYDDGFAVDDYPGVGYIFAVSAADPFDYDAVTSGDHWDYRLIADGRVRGDPYVALTDLAQRIVPDDYTDWDYDIAPYYVERHYDYPRFLCYDCHSYASYTYWNPYASSCVRFRIVVFDDPYYYPYRYYGGTRVVFTRPFRPQPRFIFRDRDGVGDDRFVTRERGRPVNDTRRRGVRGADLGGRGAIPVPGRGTLFHDNRPSRSESSRRQSEPRQSDDRGRIFDRQRSETELPSRRPDSDTRSEAPARRDTEARPDDQRRTAERPDWNPRPREETRPEQRAEPRRPESRSEPRTEPQRGKETPREDQPHAEPRRDKDSKSNDDRSKGKPELRRRRP